MYGIARQRSVRVKYVATLTLTLSEGPATDTDRADIDRLMSWFEQQTDGVVVTVEEDDDTMAVAQLTFGLEASDLIVPTGAFWSVHRRTQVLCQTGWGTIPLTRWTFGALSLLTQDEVQRKSKQLDELLTTTA
jgi:hypothetical protein